MHGETAVLDLLAGYTPMLPVPVMEEAVSGRLLQVTKAEQRRREDLLAEALDRLADLLEFARTVRILRYPAAAHGIYRSLASGRGQRSRADLRIAAICLAHGVPLLTRNAADFQDLPGLDLRTW